MFVHAVRQRVDTGGAKGMMRIYVPVSIAPVTNHYPITRPLNVGVSNQKTCIKRKVRIPSRQLVNCCN